MNKNLPNQLETLILKNIKGKGDSDKHLMSLFSIALASGTKNILELGVRNGDTSLPLLMAANLNGGILHSVDINLTSFVPPTELKNNWKFYQNDAIEFLSNWDRNIDVGLVYIDDWHSYEHVKQELELLDSIVSPQTVIILHDLMYGNTCPFYHADLTQSAGEQWNNGGPYKAVAELDPQFWEFSTLPWNNGLTILRKKYSNKYKQK